MLSHLKNVMEIINNYTNIKYYVYLNTESELIISYAKQLFPHMCVIINQVKRVGGDEHSYTHMCFEIQAQIHEDDKQYEILGGGSYHIKYKDGTIYATGYAFGIERLIYFMTYNVDEEIIINHLMQLIQKLRAPAEEKKVYLHTQRDDVQIINTAKSLLEHGNLSIYIK